MRSRRRPLLYCGSEESSPPTTPHSQHTSPTYPHQTCAVVYRRHVALALPSQRHPRFHLTSIVSPPFNPSSGFSLSLSLILSPSSRPTRAIFSTLCYPLSPSILPVLELYFSFYVCDRRRPTEHGQLKARRLHSALLAGAKNIPRAFTHTCSRVLQYCRAYHCFAVERNDVRSRNAELLPFFYALFTSFSRTCPALSYKLLQTSCDAIA